MATMTLREKAIAAHAAAVAAAASVAAQREAEERAANIASFSAALSTLLQEPIVADDLQIEIGGIPFCWTARRNQASETDHILIGIPCSRAGCDGLTWHRMRLDYFATATLADVGRVLTETDPIPCCRHYDEDGELIADTEEVA